VTRTKFNSLNPKAAAAAADTGMRGPETQPITLCVHVGSMGGEAQSRKGMVKRHQHVSLTWRMTGENITIISISTPKKNEVEIKT
jgi:hypothetical protein